MITVPERIDFAKIPQVVDIPHLLEVQLASYERFLQRGVPMDKRESIGLESVFHSVFPVVSARGEFTLEYLGYSMGEPKYGVEECKERDLTFAAPLKAALRLVVRENQDGEQVIKDIIQSEVYLGEIPLITDMGTFIINGAERVIVSQLHRSPGVVFDDDYHPNGKRLFNARIIPYRGSWVEFTIDVNDIMYVYIDRRRKIPVTVLLKAMGFSPNSAIIKLFHRTEVVDLSGRSSKKDGGLVGRYVAEDVVSRETGEVILEAGKPIVETELEKMKMAKVAEDRSRREGRESRGGRDHQDPRQGSHLERRGGAQAPLQSYATGGSAERRHGEGAPRQAVLQPEALQSREGRPPQDEPAAPDRRAHGHDDPDRKGFRRGRGQSHPAEGARRSRSTTSTISAIAGCAPSASSCRTSSPWGSRAWRGSFANA